MNDMHDMSDKKEKPTQKTKPKKGKPVEIPIPTKRDVLRDLVKIARDNRQRD